MILTVDQIQGRTIPKSYHMFLKRPWKTKPSLPIIKSATTKKTDSFVRFFLFDSVTFRGLHTICMMHAVHVCMLSCFSRVRLYNLLDCSPPGSSVCGILEARTLSGLPCPPPGVLPDPGIETASPATSGLQVDSLLLSHQGSPNRLYPNTELKV